MIILVILYRRPEYTERCLNAIAKLQGIENCKLFFQIDPGYEEVYKHAFNWTLTESEIFINKERLGCNGNVYTGLERAFYNDEQVLVIEDDVEIASDFIKFAEPFKYDRSVNVVSAYRRHLQMPELDLSGYKQQHQFEVWAWMSWRNRYYKFRDCFETNKVNSMSWDTHLNYCYFLKTEKPTVIVPNVGRSFNFGKDLGTFCSSEALYYRDNYTKYHWNGKELSENH